MPRALSVYLPRWSIDLAIRKRQRQAPATRGGGPTGPPEHTAVLLVTSRQGKEFVAACCPRAEAKGVRIGMSLVHARALLTAGRLWIQPFTPDEDEQRLYRLGRWAFRFSPVVAVDPPDGLLIDIAGGEHLFGGEKRLAEQVDEALRRFGFSTRLAVAPTFACARAIARFGRNRLTFISDDGLRDALLPLPLAALNDCARICKTPEPRASARAKRSQRGRCSIAHGHTGIEPQVYDALAEVGIEQIGQLLSLPREELAARFGNALLGRIDQALGTAPERIKPLRPNPTFEAVEVFDGPITRFDIVRAAVDRLLAMVMDQLAKHGRGACRVTLTFRRVNAEPTCLTLSLSYPTRHGGHLRSLLGPKLERVNVGYGVEEIVLHALDTQRLDHEQMEFWQPDPSKNRAAMTATLGRLLDQLLDRLGQNAITRIEPVETYVPEQAFRSIAAGRESARESGKASIYSASRPSHLFEMPEPVRVIAIVPDGPPAWLSWRGNDRAVVSSYGPERIALPWWSCRVRCADLSTRDYYEVQDEFGRWLWLFRDCASGQWFVHGEWT